MTSLCVKEASGYIGIVFPMVFVICVKFMTNIKFHFVGWKWQNYHINFFKMSISGRSVYFWKRSLLSECQETQTRITSRFYQTLLELAALLTRNPCIKRWFMHIDAVMYVLGYTLVTNQAESSRSWAPFVLVLSAVAGQQVRSVFWVDIDPILCKLVGNKIMHNTLDEFESQPDRTTDYGVS